MFLCALGALWLTDHLGRPAGPGAPLAAASVPRRSGPLAGAPVLGPTGPPAADRAEPRAADGAALLRRFAPELRYARGETSFATDVRAFTAAATVTRAGRRMRGVTPGALRPGDRLDGPSAGLTERGDVAYGHVAHDAAGRTWLQYWLFSTDNLQDRGVVRTGRHEGDWELVQLGLGAAGQPAVATYAKHAWAEACGAGALEHTGEHPIVYVARGSHASYPDAGVHGRPWPDPNDHADGMGRRTVPRVVPIDDGAPAWVAWPGRWGGTRARPWIPGEASSPFGPRFQPRRMWQDPAGFHTSARRCGTGAPPRPLLADTALALPPALLATALTLALLRTRRRRRG